MFTKVAAGQGDPLKVTDTVPTADGDPTGQGIFFLLVAVSIGSESKRRKAGVEAAAAGTDVVAGSAEAGGAHGPKYAARTGAGARTEAGDEEEIEEEMEEAVGV